MTESNQNNNAQTISSEEEKIALAKEKRRLAQKRYYQNNKEKCKASSDKWAKSNKDVVDQQRQKAAIKYYEKNKEKCKANSLAWARANKELIKERVKEKSKQYSKTYYEKNKKKAIQSQKKWRQKNKDLSREINKRHRQNRRLRDPLFVAKEKIRACVRAAFKRIKANKFTDTQRLLGCTWQEAKYHLESLWTEGMSWENHGNGPGTWNIDHVRPVHTFTEGDLHLMNHFKNLQPLWWEENNKKSGLW